MDAMKKLFRQLPKNKVNLEQLRLVAVRGKKPGNKGRETYFYKKVNSSIKPQLYFLANLFSIFIAGVC